MQIGSCSSSSKVSGLYLRLVSTPLDPVDEAKAKDAREVDDGDLFLKASAMELAMALSGFTAMLRGGDRFGEWLSSLGGGENCSVGSTTPDPVATDCFSGEPAVDKESKALRNEDGLDRCR